MKRKLSDPQPQPPSWEEFTALADRFENDPDIENYIALRRRFRATGVDITRFSLFDPLSAMRAELTQYGISPMTVAGALDGNDRELDELSLQIIEALIKRRHLEKVGRTHLQRRGTAIPDGLVNHLIITMLEAIGRYEVALPPSLIVLIRELLGGAHPALHTRQETRSKRSDAIFLGFRLFEAGEIPSIRRVARSMGVQASTVSRWFPNGDFQNEVEQLRRMLKALDAPTSKGRTT